MADESRWSEDDRFGRRDEGPRYGNYRDRDFGRFGRTQGQGDPGRQYGASYGGAYGSFSGDYGRSEYDRDRYDWQRYGRDYGEPYRGYGYGRGGYGGPGARGRSAGRDDRHWWERASDEVSSWFGDQEAERRREMDATERGHRGRGPKGYVRSDERIREDVCDRLSDDPIVDASNIDVLVAGSEVTLSGTVESREERRRAEECVERISGVSHVQNNLRVSASGSMPDAGMGRTATPTRNSGMPTGRASH